MSVTLGDKATEESAFHKVLRRIGKQQIELVGLLRELIEAIPHGPLRERAQETLDDYDGNCMEDDDESNT